LMDGNIQKWIYFIAKWKNSGLRKQGLIIGFIN